MKEIKHRRPHTVKFHLYVMSQMGTIETESQLMVARVWRQNRMGSDYLMGTKSPLGVMEVFWKSIRMIVAQHCRSIK
jgi:hypothetical protein